MSKMLSKEFGEEIKDTQVRGYLRYNPNIEKPEKKVEHKPLLDLLQKENSLAELSDKSGMSARMVLAQIDDYREAGYQITEVNGNYLLTKILIPEDNTHNADWTGNTTVKFGVISDTHLCSKDQQLTHLNTFYDMLIDDGITECYHAGDLSEGVNMRTGHEYEVFRHGVDSQAEYIIDKYPRREGLKTYYITGNHDHSGIKSAGVDIGKIISNSRDDLIYLGKQSARVMITPNCSMDLVHPLDGASYAISYATQKYIDSLSGGEKSRILFIGHHHKAFMLPVYRNIAAFESGTFQRQTKWMQGKRLSAHVGGWIIEAKVDNDGTIKRIKGEFVPFYTMIEKDY